jgi:Uma2 family endonuclease
MASMHAGLFPRFTFEEYLAKNARSSEKLEFLQGVVYAMAGGSRLLSRCECVLRG